MLFALAIAFLLGAAASICGLVLFVMIFATKKAIKNEAIASNVKYPAFARVLRERHTPLTPAAREFEPFVSGIRSKLTAKDVPDPDKFIKEKEKERKSKMHLEKEEEKKEKKVKKLEKKQRKEEIAYTKKLEKEDRKTEEKEKEKEEKEQREKEKAEKYQEKLKKKEEKEKEKEKRKEEEEREKLKKKEEKERREQEKREEKERREREEKSSGGSHILRRNGSSSSIAEDREKAVGVMMRESGGLLKEGWIHIRSTSSWSKRWLQVCNDRLFWYKNEKVHELQGIIALGGCNLIPRRRKASTPEDMLEVSHPERRNIFARVGPQNERLAPWSSHGQHHILLRFKSAEEMREWLGIMKRFAESEPDRNIHLLENAQSLEAAAAAAGTKNDSSTHDEAQLYREADSDEGSDVPESEDSEVFQEIKAAMSTSRSPPENPADAPTRGPILHKTQSDFSSNSSSLRRAMGMSDGTSTSSVSPMKQRKKKGWLDLKSYRGTFRRIWVVLRNDILVLAKTETMGDTYGFIRLEGCEVRRLTDGFGEKRPFVFEIYSPSKRSVFTYKKDKKKLPPSFAPNCIIAASSEEDLQEWLTEIHTMCPLRDPATVPFAVTAPFAVPPHKCGVDEQAPNPNASAPRIDPHPDSKGTPATPLPHLDSLNLLLQRYFRDMQDSRTFHNDMLRRLIRKLTASERPGWLGQITIQELDVGHSFPEFRNLVIMPTAVPNELIGEADLFYEGGMGITIATEIYLNWPRNKFATVPLLASIRVTHLSGKLYFYGPPELQGRFYLSFGALPLTKFDVDIRIGENEMKVLKLPRLRDYLISTFHKVLYERSVHPNRITFSLPFPGRKFNFKAECLTKKSIHSRDNRAAVDVTRESAEVYARKFLISRFFNEVLNQGQLHVVDELFDRNVLFSGGAPASIGQPVTGIDAVKRFVVDLRCGFPNMVFAIEDLAYENSNIHCRWRGKGTHTGTFWEVGATGRDVELAAILVSKFQAELILDLGLYWDLTSSFFSLFARRRDT